MVAPYHTKCEKKICGSFVRVQLSFLSPRDTQFPSHFFPYLEKLTCFHGKDLIVQSLYAHLMDRKAGWK